MHHYGTVTILHKLPHMEHFKNLPTAAREMERNSFSNQQPLNSIRVSALTWTID